MPAEPIPFQLLKLIYGLRQGADLRLPVLVSHDATLMQMDAPVILPAGSVRKSVNLPGRAPVGCGSLCARPGTWNLHQSDATAAGLRAGEGK